jgi:hypothetical protein
MVQHERRHGDGLADNPLVHHLAASLEPAAEKRIRRAADQESPLPRHLQHLPPVFQAYGERLLRVDVLARPKRHHRDLSVYGRDGEVEDDLDLLISEQLLRRASLWRAEGLRLGLGSLEYEVRTGGPSRCRRIRSRFRGRCR